MANQDCGLFNWNEEISLIEKNKLEDKACALAIKVNRLKEHNAGNRINEEDPCEVTMLKDETTSLRIKILKEKLKRGKLRRN